MNAKLHTIPPAILCKPCPGPAQFGQEPLIRMRAYPCQLPSALESPDRVSLCAVVPAVLQTAQSRRRQREREQRREQARQRREQQELLFQLEQAQWDQQLQQQVIHD